ncbi:hypothetical protein ACIO8H_07880 [Streptomyces sp. NPDC087226]|uniref:hypothetical protein n=1 Tax=Streptomyces sp. NPDC087226 TaxID=3365771 RepID=UPI00382327E2
MATLMAPAYVSARDAVVARDLPWGVTGNSPLTGAVQEVSALAAYTRPATDSLVNADVANRTTLTGASCFSVGGLLQFCERTDRAGPLRPGATGGVSMRESGPAGRDQWPKAGQPRRRFGERPAPPAQPTYPASRRAPDVT